MAKLKGVPVAKRALLVVSRFLGRPVRTRLDVTFSLRMLKSLARLDPAEATLLDETEWPRTERPSPV